MPPGATRHGKMWATAPQFCGLKILRDGIRGCTDLRCSVQAFDEIGGEAGALRLAGPRRWGADRGTRTTGGDPTNCRIAPPGLVAARHRRQSEWDSFTCYCPEHIGECGRPQGPVIGTVGTSAPPIRMLPMTPMHLRGQPRQRAGDRQKHSFVRQIRASTSLLIMTTRRTLAQNISEPCCKVPYE
jgi:hypothetical protein